MAKTKDEEAPKEAKEKKKPEGGAEKQQKPKGEKGQKGQKQAAAQPAADEPEDKTPPPPPRLRNYYHSVVRAKLAKQFAFKNPHQVPKLSKIVLNVGAGEANKNPKLLDTIVAELGAITGQKPLVTR